MAIFGVRTDNKPVVKQFVKEVAERVNGGDLVKNPFTGYAKIIVTKPNPQETTTIIKMSPLWPNFAPWGALMTFIGWLIFGGVTHPFYLLIPLSFLVLGFFWTEDFFYLTFKLGLRKAGYKGPIKRIKLKVLVDELAGRL